MTTKGVKPGIAVRRGPHPQPAILVSGESKVTVRNLGVESQLGRAAILIWGPESEARLAR